MSEERRDSVLMRQQPNKLVRDRIPDIIRQSGKQCEVAVMAEAEFRQALREKLLEEAGEVAAASLENLVSELADLQEVIDALLKVYGIEREAIAKEQRRKRTERGSFEQRLRLLWFD
ncbi:MAG TPA: nucleoside triphosphate pyrophosphohydrolase [Coleofasciculaceae cyanobacterium]